MKRHSVPLTMITSKKIAVIIISIVIVSTSVAVPTIIFQLNQEVKEPDTEPDPSSDNNKEPVLTIDTIIIDGINFTFHIFLWRDFQPIGPPNGTSLLAVVYLVATNVETFPVEKISCNRMMVFYQNDTWSATFVFQEAGYPNPNSLWLGASGGPKWGPFVHVDVILELIYLDKIGLYITAYNVCIWKTQ